MNFSDIAAKITSDHISLENGHLIEFNIAGERGVIRTFLNVDPKTGIIRGITLSAILRDDGILRSLGETVSRLKIVEELKEVLQPICLFKKQIDDLKTQRKTAEDTRKKSDHPDDVSEAEQDLTRQIAAAREETHLMPIPEFNEATSGILGGLAKTTGCTLELGKPFGPTNPEVDDLNAYIGTLGKHADLTQHVRFLPQLAFETDESLAQRMSRVADYIKETKPLCVCLQEVTVSPSSQCKLAQALKGTSYGLLVHPDRSQSSEENPSTFSGLLYDKDQLTLINPTEVNPYYADALNTASAFKDICKMAGGISGAPQKARVDTFIDKDGTLHILGSLHCDYTAANIPGETCGSLTIDIIKRLVAQVPGCAIGADFNTQKKGDLETYARTDFPGVSVAIEATPETTNPTLDGMFVSQKPECDWRDLSQKIKTLNDFTQTEYNKLLRPKTSAPEYTTLLAAIQGKVVELFPAS